MQKSHSLSEVHAKGIEVFENQEDFEVWLHAKIPALLNQKPLDLVDSEMGRKQVLNILNAILHGIHT
ncbi:MbcA/ParS/Xre antitoxin family protein [Larkinella humicola]|uniref:DUF2384 domain-containing protein n=1 Tax=Larkinella humicola TaxID=2607654 RepID=A0A5N1J6C7_9BACT|nr:MbcA/ParS/Xre antitoxin family protein [Larkinella humicola]KAA9346250.1 DUF2384 domain-containing protein [Larkinella humicola]